MKRMYMIPLICVITVTSFKCILTYMENCRRKEEAFAKTLEKAGIPDQMDINDETQMENAKMVSEGSQFGVHYFNEFAEEQMKDK